RFKMADDNPQITLRRATREDTPTLGRIVYEAFKAIADEHNFPPDFESAERAIGTVGSILASPGFYSVVAEIDGRVAGSNFMDERNPIAGIGPITVDPSIQNQGIGRRMMIDAIERARARGFAGTRLVQT